MRARPPHESLAARTSSGRALAVIPPRLHAPRLRGGRVGGVGWPYRCEESLTTVAYQTDLA